MMNNQSFSPDASVISERPAIPLAMLAQVRNLFAAWHRQRQQRLPRELQTLTDDMLLDIGIDPRRVPNPAGDIIPRPDLNRSGLAIPIWRTTAKS